MSLNKKGWSLTKPNLTYRNFNHSYLNISQSSPNPNLSYPLRDICMVTEVDDWLVGNAVRMSDGRGSPQCKILNLYITPHFHK